MPPISRRALTRRTALLSSLIGLGGLRDCASGSDDPQQAPQTSSPPQSSSSISIPTPSAVAEWYGASSTPTWSDEFLSASPGTAQAPRSDHWGHELGADGLGNNELQEYTDSLQNSAVIDDHLEISVQSSNGVAPFTSARLTSISRVRVGYGYSEARLRLPTAPASGIWPAFWLLPQSEPWPAGGEIDVMETVNGVDGWSSNLHGSGSNGHWQAYDWHQIEVNDGRWHRFGVLHRPHLISFWLDDTLVHQTDRGSIAPGDEWPFDVAGRRFYFLLNVAVGGDYPGEPDGTAALPATMAVDHVRHWSTDGGTVDLG